MQKIELLAPAGDFESLKAAVEAGADAVYLASNHFGARAYAGNFTDEELTEAVAFAHLRGVAIHVTVNTIVADDELRALREYLRFLDRISVDAVLVQDLGTALLARQEVPDLPLHASTQMTVHSLEGVKALEELGFTRVVLSRELSLDEIKHICEHSTAEIEVFMHGALCVCYSGQCLMSSMIGARSGNRGRCAQPCRLPYELVDDRGEGVLADRAGKYLLSPKDLNTIDILPELIGTGVSSLKIEGRMKRPEYVAVVVETYRKALDRLYKRPLEYKATAEEHRNLAQIFNRDFTTAYLEKNQGSNMISDRRPNNRGVPVGRVAAVGGGTVSIKTTEKITAGDQLEIWVKVGGRVTITVNDLTLNADTCTIKTKENISGVRPNDRVFKVFDAKLTAHARKFFTSAAPIRKIPVRFEAIAKLGKPFTLRITLDDGNWDYIEVETDYIVETAKNRPTDMSIVAKQVSRLGDTAFDLMSLGAYIDYDVMVPVSVINDARRRATKQLEGVLLDRMRNRRPSPKYNKNLGEVDLTPYIAIAKNTALTVHVDMLEMLRTAIAAGADAILFGGDSYRHQALTPADYQQAIETAHLAGVKIYIATPRIVRNAEQHALEAILTSVDESDGVYIHNIATLHLAARLTPLPIYTDYSLITFNAATIKYLKALNVAGVTLSPELTFDQVKALAKTSPLPVECIVHGRTELMISSYCTMGSFLGGVGEHKCSQPCKRQHFFLRDRKSTLFPLFTDQFCRMHILNSKPLSMLPYAADFKKAGISKIRIDGRAMPVSELENTIKNYRRALQGDIINEPENLDFTRGHYFRGVVSTGGHCN